MRTRAWVVLGFFAAVGTGCVTTAVDQAITQDMRKKDPTACEGGRTWRRAANAPTDCVQGDSRELCREACFAPGE